MTSDSARASENIGTIAEAARHATNAEGRFRSGIPPLITAILSHKKALR